MWKSEYKLLGILRFFLVICLLFWLLCFTQLFFNEWRCTNKLGFKVKQRRFSINKWCDFYSQILETVRLRVDLTDWVHQGKTCKSFNSLEFVNIFNVEASIVKSTRPLIKCLLLKDGRMCTGGSINWVFIINDNLWILWNTLFNWLFVWLRLNMLVLTN